tara:strand:+ start:63 stop:215 length:153 start_codon:yes stop_codon:yes gene_type:complete
MKLKIIIKINQSVEGYLKDGGRIINMDNLGAMGMAVAVLFVVFMVVNILF